MAGVYKVITKLKFKRKLEGGTIKEINRMLKKAYLYYEVVKVEEGKDGSVLVIYTFKAAGEIKDARGGLLFFCNDDIEILDFNFDGIYMRKKGPLEQMADDLLKRRLSEE